MGDERHLVLRFDTVERAAHWVNAVLFSTLILTALPLYFAQIEQFVGRRHLLVEIHVWSGIALPVPLLISLAGPWGRRFRADLRRCNLWTRDEILWLKTLGRHRLRRADKFNPGQKLNVIFIGSVIVVMLGTGSIMYWLQYFPLEWRTGATFVHDVVAAAIFIVIVGHILFALTHIDALKSMFSGYVTSRWAERHAAGWLDELVAENATHPGTSALGSETVDAAPAAEASALHLGP